MFCAKSHSTFLSPNSSWPTCPKSPVQAACQTVHCITRRRNGLVGIGSHREGNVLRVSEAAHCPGEIKPCLPVMMPAFLSGLSCCSSGKMRSILLIAEDHKLCCASHLLIKGQMMQFWFPSKGNWPVHLIKAASKALNKVSSLGWQNPIRFELSLKRRFTFKGTCENLS